MIDKNLIEKDHNFIFSAIVGLEELKLALLLNAIDPTIGGVLIKGQKGTGKSMAVRAFANVLPNVLVSNCQFNCSPSNSSIQCDNCNSKFKSNSIETITRPMKLVTLPLGVSEDRVIGSLDIEKVLKDGVKALESGILAEANQGILYVDEINLLADHIIDDLLDVIASGWNHIERSGVSVRHPSRFIFIGSMNPEEGELRPQILDRLPLVVNVKGSKDIESRINIIERNLLFETEPKKFQNDWKLSNDEIMEAIKNAKKQLLNVKISKDIIVSIAKLCAYLKLDGYRPDIVLAKTSIALAAWEGKSEVDISHIKKCAHLVLLHRTREGGLLNPPTEEEIRKGFKLMEKK